MIPNATQERAEKLLGLYAEAEEMLLARLAAQLKGIDRRDTSAWIQGKLTQTSKLRVELQAAVDDLDRRSAAERVALMWSAHDEGADGLYRELGLEGKPSARSQSIVALIDDADGRFSELHRRILRDVEDAYRDALADALPYAVMGVESTQQALTRALNELADRGLVAFVDKAGRRWGLPEYAEMATRTGMMLSMLAGYTQEALAHGEDLVIISDHYDECPLCAPWERKVLSLTGASARDKDCDGTLADARAAGLFHPGCLHAMTVYVPGLTIKDAGKRGKRTAAQDKQGYKDRQQQRYAERMVRRWKRRQAVALTPQEEREARAHVEQWQRKLRAATAASNLPRKYNREGGRVKLSENARKLRPYIVFGNGMAGPKPK